MLKTLPLVFLFCLFGSTAAAQTTVYKDLDTLDFYPKRTSYEKVHGVHHYKVNGERVSKATYKKYESSWDNMENCCPCVLRRYNSQDQLIHEAVSCTDAWIGKYKEFSPEGHLIEAGQFVEIPDVSIENIGERYNIKDGAWNYFNKSGDTLFTENWDKGDFISQVPEQTKLEIWKMEVKLDDNSVESNAIPYKRLGEVEFIPHFKNSNQNVELRVKLEVSAINHVQNLKEFSLNEFKQVDLKKLMKEVDIQKKDKPNFWLYVFTKEQRFGFYLDIKL